MRCSMSRAWMTERYRAARRRRRSASSAKATSGERVAPGELPTVEQPHPLSTSMGPPLEELVLAPPAPELELPMEGLTRTLVDADAEPAPLLIESWKAIGVSVATVGA